jgi:hypothetical protein
MLLRTGCDVAEGDVLSKMDDDNWHGEHYIGDLVDALAYTDADIVGKFACYTYLGARNVMALRFPEAEHRYNDLVQGGTITFRRSVLEKVTFPDLPRAVDTGFLRAAGEAGIKVYSADRFNFVSVREPDTAEHTWKISEDELLLRGVAQVFGRAFEHAAA